MRYKLERRTIDNHWHSVDTEHIDALYSYAFVLTANSSEATNLTLATFELAAESYRNSKTQALTKAWFFTTLRSKWCNGRREQPNRSNKNEAFCDAGDTNPLRKTEALSPQKATTKRASEEIQRLALIEREVIVLREHEGFSYREIAALLDCTIETVIQQLRQARATLYQRLVLDTKC